MCVRENNWRSEDTAQNECSCLPQKSQRERGPTHEKCPRGKARSLPKLKRRRFRRKSKLKWQRRRYRLPAPRFALLPFPRANFCAAFAAASHATVICEQTKNRKTGPRRPLRLPTRLPDDPGDAAVPKCTDMRATSRFVGRIQRRTAARSGPDRIGAPPDPLPVKLGLPFVALCCVCDDDVQHWRAFIKPFPYFVSGRKRKRKKICMRRTFSIENTLGTKECV